MKKEDNIQQQIEDTFSSIDAIENVQVSPFLKGKILTKFFEEKEERPQVILPWFTPKLQVVALALIVIINVTAFVIINSNKSTETITEFAEAYELSPDSEITIFD